MIETVIKIDGMMCGMCESHIKGETVIVSEAPLNEAALRTAIAETGYEVTDVSSKPYKKKGLFGFLKK